MCESCPAATDRTLTKHNRTLLDGIDLGQVEEVWFKGPDGNDLQGWILKPPAFDPSKKYPSILEIHGGPITQYGTYFMHEFYYLASKGFVVYFSNPRGGRGYGEAHAKAIWGGWGDADYADLMAWTDYMEKQAYIDPAAHGRHRRFLRRVYDRVDHRAHPALQGRRYPALRQQFHLHVGLERHELDLPAGVERQAAL